MHTSKHALFRLKITVGCRLCACPSIRVYVRRVVCVACVCVVSCVCAWCVCVFCVFCMLCVWRGLARRPPLSPPSSVCWSKTSPCVPAKRPHVFSFSLSVFSLSLFPPFIFSVVLFLFSLSLLSSPALVVSLSPLSATMTMITRPVGLSLCTQSSDLPECHNFGSFLVWPNMFDHITVQASCWKWVMWLCLFVFGCVNMCLAV